MFEHVKWVFFDVGSTLVDESIPYEHRIRDMAAAAGRTYESVFDTALGFYRQNRKGDRETAKVLGVAVPAWHKEEEALYSDAAECLQEIRCRYRIGIIANQPPGTTERLRRFGILPYIDIVAASAEEGVEKPDKRIFTLALEKSGCRPGEAVMIGDRIDNDIVPAKSLGMHTIWIRQGFGQYWNITMDSEKADCTVNRLTEICAVL